MRRRLIILLIVSLYSYPALSDGHGSDHATTSSSAKSSSLNATQAVDDGIVSVKSAYTFEETIDRLTEALDEKGMKVFATLPHSKGAASVGVELRDTSLVIFGNPKVGAPLMACQQSVALDLPQKALIHTRANGEVWLSYNDLICTNTKRKNI